MTSVPLLDLKAQFQQIRAEVMPVIEQVCASQHFILGEHVSAFETEAAAYCGSQHGIGVSSGTDALLLALMALGIGTGDEVITSPFTFFATAGAIARVGARPLFCDIDAATFNISPTAVQDLVEQQCEPSEGCLINRATGCQVKALMPVHLYGQSADMMPLSTLARANGLHVIEDAAQAIGTESAPHSKDGAPPSKGSAPSGEASASAGARRVGSLGEVGCFSFFPSKNLGAFGDAGLCTTDDAELAERMRVLRVHGGKPKYFHALIGGNFRIDALQAAVLRVKLKYLDGWTSARQANAAFYRAAFRAAGLVPHVGLPEVMPGRHIFNQFVVRVRDRDRLKSFLGERSIGTEIYYPVPLHLQECFAYLGYRSGDFPEAERAATETLALPVYPELTRAQLEHVVARIADFYS